MPASLRFLIIVIVAGWGHTAHAQECARNCLEDLVGTYLDAVQARNPGLMTLTADARFTENTIAIEPGDGIWQTIDAGSIAEAQLFLTDVSTNQAAWFGAATENGHGVLLTVRLRHENERVSEVETLITRRSPAMFGNFDDFPEPDASWTRAVDSDKRSSRTTIVAAAHAYFDGIEQSNGDIVPLSNSTIRIENGVQTAPRTDGDRAGMSIRETFNSGMFSYITAIDPRRIVLVDEERGVVLSQVMFQHPGNVFPEAFADRLDDPSSVLVYPNSIGIMEAFQVIDGQITQIFAHMVMLPYKSESGWPADR